MKSFKNYNTLILNGKALSGSEAVAFCEASKLKIIREVGVFMEDWLRESPVIKVGTSGSTGKPKEWWVEKDKMLKSAAATGKFFGFEAGQKALLCLPLSYIAGKMMVVRALFSSLNLICMEPSSDPLKQLPSDDAIDFAPLTPMQISTATGSKSISAILLGGGAIDPVLEEKLQHFKARIYHGYGMTETLSHVALRKVNGEKRSEIYEALPGVFFEKDERDCLVIQVPFLEHPVVTNDLVELKSPQSFIWKGRWDYVINSGGVKLFPEVIEKKIAGCLSSPFFVAGLPDRILGERLCLFVEGGEERGAKGSPLADQISATVAKFEKPKEIFFLDHFERTPSGKVWRKATLQKFLNLKQFKK